MRSTSTPHARGTGTEGCASDRWGTLDIRYLAYCVANPRYYDSPQQAAEDSSQEGYATVVEPAPGWRSRTRGQWTYLRPPQEELPEQGWKIHVSATLGNAREVLRVTSAYCTARSLPHKYLSTPAVLLTSNTKYAPRASSGKFITIYPGDADQLHRTLGDLDAELGGLEGPYILSDLRWNEGPLYVRYGGFTPMFTHTAEGTRAPAIRHPEGHLVPDHREPRFLVPEWVDVPDFLSVSAERRVSGEGAERFPYEVENPIHFSNGGGVYRVRRRTDGRPLILKEGRPHAGLDRAGRDAPTRLSAEARALDALEGISGVPQVEGQHEFGGHSFLAMEQMPGIPLNSWLALHYPFTTADPRGPESVDYLDSVQRIMTQVRRILGDIHERGYLFRDLHAGNILVDDDLRVSVIDFELSLPVAEDVPRTLGAPGFTPPRDTLGVAGDLFSLAAVQLFLLFPMNSVLSLCPEKAAAYMDEAVRRFGVSRDDFRRMEPLVDTGVAPSGLRAPDGADLPRGARDDWSRFTQALVRSIRASSSPERSDRLFPGDISQFDHGGHGFAFGAAGVLDTLRTAGEKALPEHTDWLVERTRLDHRDSVGLYDGRAGIAHVLHRGGDTEAARNVFSTCLDTSVSGIKLFDGLSGVGLTALDLYRHTSDAEYAAYAERAAHAVARAVSSRVFTTDTGTRAVPGTGSPAPNNSAASFYGGLLYGWSGPALFLTRVYEVTGEEACLDAAVEALHLDLDMCVGAPGEPLRLRNGGRLLPYLATGSAGIALVCDAVLRHRPDDRLSDALPRLTTAIATEFCVGSGLFNGRAGLVYTLHHLAHRRERFGSGTQLDEGVAALGLHAMADEHGITFPGEQNLRASHDVATGSAGVLRLANLLAGRTDEVLPFLSPSSWGRGTVTDLATAKEHTITKR
ncbi:class III lanthionine synthetase LanKC [Nocardiopsis sp. B62]|uniref:class III lanthionine synthetase LanKC n=1 Tax=Nocardiopsis sp. B62 TaxID=2824874 RepID=UPI001FFC8578|nr:class III lanthionine synthetase LanKC [Nocardiopsis sp. B62]